MHTKLINIGNSRGVRLPKPLIQQAGLRDEVELEVASGTIIISSRQDPRGDWAEAAQALSSEDSGGLIDGELPTDFDLETWEW